MYNEENGYAADVLWVYYLHVWGPESEVVPEKLHDESAVLVRLFAQRVQLGNGFFECLIRNREDKLSRVTK